MKSETFSNESIKPFNEKISVFCRLNDFANLPERNDDKKFTVFTSNEKNNKFVVTTENPFKEKFINNHFKSQKDFEKIKDSIIENYDIFNFQHVFGPYAK